jgi:hypothetical protein
MRNYPDIGVQVSEVLAPALTVDLQKWAVIACDQFTSQPEYWQKVSELVGDSPSTLHLILPEVYLGSPEEHARVVSSQEQMKQYLENGLLVAHQGLVYVERAVDGKTRHGLMLALDLERYDFNKGSQSLIRATEGTILERLPPRVRIREGAPLEVPHILVLIDDPQRTVIEPVANQKQQLTPLYDTDLMLGSGHLQGYLVDQQAMEEKVIAALRALANPDHFYQKYGVDREKGVLLFAMGDGNHSLATAKSIWEQLKDSVGPEHPARYALVEIENIHDEGLVFEPIHRVLFGVSGSLETALADYFGSRARVTPVSGGREMIDMVNHQTGAVQQVGLVSPDGCAVITISQPDSNLAVGSLQAFLDDWGKKGGFGQIDYVHGDEVVSELGAQGGNLGFYLPAIDKNKLFRTVILDGSLPRKTFSMGEAHEKRFYMESRRITA